MCVFILCTLTACVTTASGIVQRTAVQVPALWREELTLTASMEISTPFMEIANTFLQR